MQINIYIVYLFIYITVVHGDTEFVVLNFCTLNVFGQLNKPHKNLIDHW